MSLTFKIGSLFIRTAAKPIGNWIKGQAREHGNFRNTCIAFAQRLHRLDMRMRLGLLQDPAQIERQIQREAAEAEAKRKQRSSIPTVKSEEETKADEAAREKEKEDIKNKVKKPRRIRPLSEDKAIDTGASFISETFLFMVAGGLIVVESFRSRRKEYNRREDVAEQLEILNEENRKREEADRKHDEERRKHEEEIRELKELIKISRSTDGALGAELKLPIAAKSSSTSSAEGRDEDQKSKAPRTSSPENQNINERHMPEESQTPQENKSSEH
ncbi:MAG: hypothetical protein M1831_000912 [Alyxoria varia]|nr:MAG: hypothetical protein M1831_000912 [Alyxoria varia]